jgi:hypothetical protein
LNLTRTGDSLRLRVTNVAPNRAYVLFVSRNLLEWTPLDTITSTGFEIEIIVPLGGEPALFYRLASPAGN